MLTITGHANGVPYDVTVDGGVVTGSAAIADLLSDHEGEQYAVTPTSGARALDLGDEESVLAALSALTEVTEINGDVPPLQESDEPVPADAVY